jgi:hypothetical protein
LKAFIYVIAWILLLIHVAWAFRMYDLATPVMHSERRDVATQPWWPAEWWVPTAFQHVLYLVAPPKHVEKGQTCLQQEMRCAFNAADLTKYHSKGQARETLPGLWPWKIFRGGLFAMLAVWIMIVFGRLVETFNGERKLLRQEGRVERFPSHMQPWMPPWTREAMRDEWAHTGGSDRRMHGDWTLTDNLPKLGTKRRLTENMPKENKEELIKYVAQRLSTALNAVSETLDHEVATAEHEQRGDGELRSSTNTAPLLGPLRQAVIDWPAELSELPPNAAEFAEHLACSAGGVLATIASDAQTGATIQLKQATDSATSPSAAVPPAQFSLRGLTGFGNIIGASWGAQGLLLATTSGNIAECGDQSLGVAGSAWHCASVGAMLPTGGSTHRLAAVARIPGTENLRAAVVFEGDDSLVLYELSRQDDTFEGRFWESIGEARLPPSSAGIASLSLSAAAHELLISTKDGMVIRWPLHGVPDSTSTSMFPIAAPELVAAPRVGPSTSDLEWRAACSLDGGSLAYLASSSRSGNGKLPAIFVSAARY